MGRSVLLVLILILPTFASAMDVEHTTCLSRLYAKLSQWYSRSLLNQQLYDEVASEHANLDRVRSLIQQKAAVNTHAKNLVGKRHILVEAAGYGNASIVEELCRNKADVHHVCSFGKELGAQCSRGRGFYKKTPLQVAVTCGHSEVVRILFEYGATDNHIDYPSAIGLAIHHEHTAVAVLLMRRLTVKDSNALTSAFVKEYSLYDKFDEARRIYHKEDVDLIAQKLNASDSATYRITGPVNAITAAYAAQYPLMDESPLKIAQE